MVDFNYDLSKHIENFVVYIPDQIENIEKLIHNYKIVLTENDSLKKENKKLKRKLQKYKRVPIVSCQIIK